MDRSWYQVPDLDDIEFYFENTQLDLDAALWIEIDILVCPTAFDDFGIGGLTENSILLDKKEDKENSPPATPVPKRPTRPLHCWKVVKLEQEQKMFLIMLTEICFK